MDSIKTIVPIWIAKTRSFWLGIVPTALTTVDLAFTHLTGEGSEPVANAVAAIAQQVGLDWTGEQIASFMRTLYPLYLIIFAQQRGTFSGAIPRPYTLDPKKEGQIIEMVENGKSAFDAGKKIGEAINRNLPLDR
ncbi:hypothetical protein RM190_08630 [Paracoccus sp. CPCC 101403]|jgi:hypothetical protein|uniref:Uncharacterized protein n=2 Tax=Paracoccus broussonetiae TaxID=3075834 RepID=A0ABU3ECK0_9RHOB|nr:hypothetical protein [Paracoccus sp. CPCC 101403]